MGVTVRRQFEKVLRRRAENPHVPTARLHAKGNVYKIKLRDAGYRLADEVLDDVLIIFVLGVGRRDEGYEELLRTGRESLDGFD
ncbi:MAG: type II toxin-antitoxin system RelE/ParE family toxin [Devosia sp.]|nr:type II toxin-antitoxin system RelE/ParE family toxin [Devosia sp.]